MSKDLDFLKENYIAHRGLHDSDNGIVENTITAFIKAVKKGYIIELDVHLLKDGNIVVFHDDNLYRLTKKNKKIKDCTFKEIQELKLQNTDNYIPLFKDVLKVVNGEVPLVIELKYDTKVGLLEDEVMKELKGYKGKYAIKSFNPFSVYYIKRNYPNVIIGQLACDFKGEKMNIVNKFLLKNLVFNIFTKPDFVSYCINSLPNKAVEKYRKNHIVVGWTIKSNSDLEFAKKYCDNFICENIL